MAQTGYTPIQLYHSTTPGATPLSANLLPGELALNIADGKVFYEDVGGTVKELAGGISYVYKTANYTVSNKEGVLASTAGGAFTVTLPATPAAGAQCIVADAGASFGTNNLTVARNGSTIGGLAENLILDITGVSVQFVYDGTTWEVYAQVGGAGGLIDLATQVAGTLPAANGGTGLTSPGASGNILISNGTAWTSAAPAGDGSLLRQVVFTSSGTWTKGANTKYILVQGVGGGGGGAGSRSVGADVGGAGGGAGGYFSEFIDVTSVSSNTVTIGSGGSGGAADANGSNGGNTSFGSYCSATGGTGAIYSASQNKSGNPGSGGSGSGGDVNITGGGGTTGASSPSSGAGGASFFGGGGGSVVSGNNGVSGQAPGSGGGGAGATGVAGFSGGSGASGLVIVWEYA